LQPRLEQRHRRRVLLRVDAADAAGAVVDVEVRGELRMLRLQEERTPRAAPVLRLPRLLGVGARAEVLLDVGTRAQQALLLAAPQPDADGAPGLDVHG